MTGSVKYQPRKTSEVENNNKTGDTCHKHIISIPDREAYNKLTFNEVYDYHAPPEKAIQEYAIDIARDQCYPGSCGGKCLWRFIKARLPIFGWLIKYNVRTDLLQDVMAGITVGIMQVPQAMAYAMLAKIPPIVGLYTSLFPVILYAIMGTSRHVSVGMYAIVCLMVGKVVEQYKAPDSYDSPGNLTTLLDYGSGGFGTSLGTTQDPGNGTTLAPPGDYMDPVVTATVIAFFIGAVQVLLGLFKLGGLTIYMSEVLISGYTCASSILVLTSQIPPVLGYIVPSYGGPISFFYTWIDIFKDITQTNYITVVISVIAIVILYLNKEYMSPWVQKKINCPLPMDLILIVIMTGISYATDLGGTKHKVQIVGVIANTLPTPSVPQVDKIGKIAGDSVTIALVAITVNLSMAKVFAKKYNYEVDDNQELIAHGCSNLLGSFLSCSPSGVSLSRSSVMSNYCKTQLAAVFASGLLLVVILWLTFLLKDLPECILACIIIVALKSMILQVFDLKKAWKLSKPDAMIWLVAFVATMLLDVDNGLLVGVGFSILVILFRAHVPNVRILAQVAKTDIYEDKERFSTMSHDTEILKVVQFAGPMYFANREYFRDQIYAIIQSPKQLTKQRKKHPEMVNELKYIVLDCSCWTYIDGSAISALTQILKEYEKLDIKFLFASCKDNVLEVLERSDLFSKIKSDIYPTIHDAIVAKIEQPLGLRRQGTPPPAYDNAAYVQL